MGLQSSQRGLKKRSKTVRLCAVRIIIDRFFYSAMDVCLVSEARHAFQAILGQKVHSEFGILRENVGNSGKRVNPAFSKRTSCSF